MLPLCVFPQWVSIAGTLCAVGVRDSLGHRTWTRCWSSPDCSGHGFPGLWTVQSDLYILHVVFSAFSKHRKWQQKRGAEGNWRQPYLRARVWHNDIGCLGSAPWLCRANMRKSLDFNFSSYKFGKQTFASTFWHLWIKGACCGVSSSAGWYSVL